MKKFIAGIVVGAVIASALPAYGAVTSLIGQEVEGQKAVELNGNSVGTAIIVDDKSYLPVRDTADAFGATVTPTAEVISLTTTSPDIPNDAVVSELNTLKTDKGYYEKQIEKLKSTIKNLEEVVIPKAIERMETRTFESEKLQEQKRVDDFKTALSEQKQKLADYQSKLEYINARIAELEA